MATSPPRIGEQIEPARQEARALAAPRGTYRLLPLDRAPAIGLEPIPASALVVGIVTVGDGVEKRVAEYLRQGETTRALLLDAAGSAAAEEAADHLGAIIANADPPEEPAVGSTSEPRAPVLPPDTRGFPPPLTALPVSCRISPGYGNWPMEGQRSLFELVAHERIGVTLLPSLLMIPRKSISFAMWLGADAKPLAGLSGCPRCRLAGCRYRRPATGGGKESSLG